MNSKERVEAVLRGRMPDRVPVCLHNFLPAAHEAGIPLERYLADPQAAADAHLHAVEKYGHDCILIDLDTTMLAEAMGAKRNCTPGAPGHVEAPAIRGLEQVGRLKVVDPERDGRIPVLLEAVHRLAERVGNEVSIRGNADQCAFSLAGLLRGTEDFLVDLMSDPDEPALRDLLEVSYQSHLAVHKAVFKAGAHFTSMGDSPAGPDVVSPQMFAQFARPYEERLVKDLAADGIFTTIHICGKTDVILDQLAEFPSCGFELDYKTDVVKAKSTVGAGHVLFGNIDPSGVVARGTAAQVREAAEKLMAVWKPGGRFILNAGCAIPESTPPENIAALVASAREFGRYND
ncbi:MAG TPA: uroporphyrinogen decarboxylase family protein [Kiritimatiellia bacterium]|nr:uroporphyrinogen decarboxylase family protein [Kiritimatiellia bacterium]